ncbi:MAG: hypothetical protein GPJ52_05430 [Candidatus Heimdallarchaeota archaeon]|nr:hypothetical protein [Candidatus Heimdallarchaeota archaeon]
MLRELVKKQLHLLRIVEGIGEKAIASLKVDDIVQFERFGFVRIDRKEKDKLFVNLAHK